MRFITRQARCPQGDGYRENVKRNGCAVATFLRGLFQEIRTASPGKAWSCRQNLVEFPCTLRDHKSRCSLGAVAFGVPPFAPEANVQDRCLRRRVRNSPVEKCSLRVEDRRNAHGEALAAIQRQPNFHLTAR
jgi:hypothetical protein